jgi:hypothetical protein
MSELTISKGDKGYNLAFTITDDLGVAKNLTGYTITLKMWRPGVPSPLLISGACVIDVAASGTCYYVLAAADTAATGRYLAELELTAGGVIESTVAFSIIIEESG